MGEGLLLVLPTGQAPELLRALKALFPTSNQVVDEPPPEESARALSCALDLDMDLEVGADEDHEYLLS